MFCHCPSLNGMERNSLRIPGGVITIQLDYLYSSVVMDPWLSSQMVPSTPVMELMVFYFAFL